MTLHNVVHGVSERIRERSADARTTYMDMVGRARDTGPKRAGFGCSNLAHAVAGCSAADKSALIGASKGNLAIITAYNDMLSAHKPFENFPETIRQAARAAGGTAQVAGGVPAMCDGVTQGMDGMELSLFSRDVIALSAAVGLSHNCFDGALFLGICDKIVPGLVMAAASFGHLPVIFLPAGPMPSGLSNDEKAKVRQQFAAGEVGRARLLEAEMAAYHSPGTCTFYGTANTNQLLMEVMGLHLPGASFVQPGTPLREALTRAGVARMFEITAEGNDYTPVADILDVAAFVNAIVALHATGGSTNLVIHLVAMARAAGIILKPEDFAELSEVTPLLAKVYPNGKADVNHFHAAGGLAFLLSELLEAKLLQEDVRTVVGRGLRAYTREPFLSDTEGLHWRDGSKESLDLAVFRPVANAFQAHGGLLRLSGNLGHAVMKVSAVAPERQTVQAPVRVFHDQQGVKEAFAAGELDRDVIVVVRFQGPKANGMPELHGLTPILGLLQDRGHAVALVTDGRMSGASGKIPAAIHVTPEAAEGGAIARIQDGDVIQIDATSGKLQLKVGEAELTTRPAAVADLSANNAGTGRELFAMFRQTVGSVDSGAAVAVAGT